MSDERVARCRCGHLWTVHLEGNCDGGGGEDGRVSRAACTCRGFYPEDWRPNTTNTCRGCRHAKSDHSGVSCHAVVGHDTVTERHFGFEGDTWTTKGTVDITCSCQRFW
ncbi:hypothetical protein ACIO3O_01820 [Streptomyces sp. NPDC087440]|uniref:hypothetical protein n=1 Tax=Streptomyces sp. NPDC087440 TaxID=3365790 RepID=UPI0038175CA4